MFFSVYFMHRAIVASRLGQLGLSHTCTKSADTFLRTSTTDMACHLPNCIHGTIHSYRYQHPLLAGERISRFSRPGGSGAVGLPGTGRRRCICLCSVSSSQAARNNKKYWISGLDRVPI